MKCILPLLLSLPSLAGAQVNDSKIRQQVLQAGIVDSEFVFGKWNEKGGVETHLKYLGEMTTQNGRRLRVMTSIWLWGLSRHATSRILIYDGQNRYMGEYYVGMDYDLPGKLTDGKLIFTNTEREGCDKKLVMTLNLKNGLPKEFFLECQDGYGDIYTFSSDQ